MRGSAVVVGGGIAGLATARRLLACGWRVEVRERSGGLPDAGTALGMWPEAMEALDRVGVGDRVRARSVAQHGAALLRPDGTVIARLGQRQSARLVSRPALLAALAEDLPSGVVAWHAPVPDLGALPEADVVVAADGLHSIARAAAFGGSAAARPLGTVAFRGTVPGRVDGVTETWGRGRLFGITPRDGGINWFACARADLVGPGETGPAELLRRLYRGWHPAVTAILDALEDAAIDRRTLFDVPPLRTYVSGRTVLVGDAAHAMAPNLGRGACESLVDAVTLAEALAAGTTPEEGLRRYDRLRRRPTQRIARMSRLLNRASTAVRLTGPRDALVSAMAPHVGGP